MEMMISEMPQCVIKGSNWNNPLSEEFSTAMRHPHPGRRDMAREADRRYIFVNADSVHCCKKAVKNISSSGVSKPGKKGGPTRRIWRVDPTTGKQQFLEWRMYREAWLQDRAVKGAGMFAPKVTRDHIVRGSHAQLKVNNSVQVHSSSFAKAVEVWDMPRGEAVELVKVMRMMDRYMDIMNSGTVRVPPRHIRYSFTFPWS